MSKTVICIDPSGGEYEVSADTLKWRPAAYGFVVKDGKLLLSKQYDGYDLPGGGIDLGEMPEEAVVREVKEETGIDVVNLRLLTVASGFGAWKERRVQSIAFYYQCDFAGGELSTDGFDEDEKLYADMPEWIDLAELDNIKPMNSIDYRQFIKLLKV